MNNNTEQLLNQIKQNLELLSKYSVDGLQRQEVLGRELNFSGGVEVFKNILKLTSLINPEKLVVIPEKQLRLLSDQIGHVVSLFEQIQKFNIVGNNNPARQRDQLITMVTNAYGDLFEIVLPIVSFLSSESEGKQKQELNKILKSSVTQFKSEQAKIIEDGNSMLNQINELLESSRKAAGTIGVSQYSKVFADESDYFEKSAGKWLWRVSGVLVLLVLAGGAFIRVGMNEMVQTNTLILINVTVAKVLIITALFYSLNLCLKNYKAHKHNALLNRHRQNALNTFETFAKAAGDDSQIKNAVLLEATRTIFSNQPTGYMTNENESELPTRIIEIIKSNKE